MDAAELGAFLASRRARIRPAEVGLPTGPRRRVPGLRRDEVAVLAGASVEYYTELEQGRGAHPSASVLAALARALRLSDDERDHLFHLAGRAAPATGAAAHVQPSMLALLDHLEGTPARVTTDLHVTLAQNRLGAALLGDPGPGSGPAASSVHRWFTDPASRALYPAEDHPRHSRDLVADLRAAVARRGRDPEARDLVDRLRVRSAEFTALWDSGDVAVRRSLRKRIVHPTLGVLELDCQRLVSEDGRQRLLFFTAPAGSPAAGQLDLLAVVGRQDLTGPPRR
ncbi:helix-turn-helix transcriptional regulator [Quadrisphaera sp. DSM 44207]|uniref:helix-turn-helix transcriptional regulator n=1 Tax=Quadrisphaera sp. DSM 44207 TaxID=1881057 RepID=UPI00088CDCD9|nr:helix-turn-helix transcriptional regulator [Quadrisphaera sp. DSM 44207]SDQ06475.1 Helix-turn-helix domain-containing protein [Quadrisphaera sp. DSM 44207]